jgi:hypothetical protein
MGKANNSDSNTYYYTLSIPNSKMQTPKYSKILNSSSTTLLPQMENSILTSSKGPQ